MGHGTGTGIDGADLSDEDLERELVHVHEKRHDIFLTGAADALANNLSRMLELESAYLQRFRDRIPDAAAKLEALKAGPGERASFGSQGS